MSKAFKFKVTAKAAPLIEVNDAGIYVRFQKHVKVSRTVIRSEWPHVAVDIAADNSVIGIESVPAPRQFTIGRMAERAGVYVPPAILQCESKIQTQ